MLIRPASREYRVWTTDSRRWAHYQPRPDDIIIAASAKTGQTWTQQIVSSLIFQDAVARPLLQVSPWIDRRPFGSVEDLFERIEAQKHRRFLKSHLPIDGLRLYDIIAQRRFDSAGTRCARGLLIGCKMVIDTITAAPIQAFCDRTTRPQSTEPRREGCAGPGTVAAA
jgi:Sulfotransferase domain